MAHGHKIPVRDYFIVDLALPTGLRAMEMVQLNCGDVFVRDGTYSLLVRTGKGSKKRLVRFDESSKQHYGQYIRWKQTVGEPTVPGDPPLSSSIAKSRMCTRAIKKAFKRTAAKADLPAHYSIHCPRHIYGSTLHSKPLQSTFRAEAVGSLQHSNHRSVRGRNGARYTGSFGKTVQISSNRQFRNPWSTATTKSPYPVPFLLPRNNYERGDCRL